MISLLQLPRLADEPWRNDAVCASHPEPWLWDAVRHEGESRADRERRHSDAKRICFAECTVRDQCWAAVNHEVDEGIRGGRLLREKRHDLRREPCPECEQPTIVNKMSRHLKTHQKRAS